MADIQVAVPVVEVNAVVLDIDKIRLKFLGLPGDCGPDLIMDFDLARSIITSLHKCLPETAKNVSNAIKVIAILTGATLTGAEYREILDVATKATQPESVG